MATIILRTPLGIYWIDPFAPPDPTVSRIVKALGIELELKVGPPSQEDLDAPQLSSGLLMIGGALGLLVWNAWRSRR